VSVYLVGSSKNMTGGLLTSSRAIDRRFLCPPDRLPLLVSLSSSSPRLSSTLSTWQHTHKHYCGLPFISHPVQLSLAIPSWVGAMSTSQRTVTLCIVRLWVAGKTVDPLVTHGPYLCAVERYPWQSAIQIRVTLLHFTLASSPFYYRATSIACNAV